MADSRWPAAAGATPLDVFYSPDYARFRVEALGERPIALVYEDSLGRVLDVTSIKQIAKLPFFSRIAGSLARPRVDLASPEYNGPIVVAEPGAEDDLLRRYRSAVDEYCSDLGVVTEFVRLHPFETRDATLRALSPLVSVSDVVYVDLRGGYTSARAGYQKRRLTQVRQAETAGVEIRFASPDADASQRFSDLYAETIAGKSDVKSYHRRPAGFFASLFRHLGERALLVESYVEGALASAAIALLGPRRAWYMYAGRQPNAATKGAHKLLLDRLVAKASERGLEALVLGGGFDPGDGLYYFKRGFSKLTLPVRQLRRVHDGATLALLEQAKAEHDSALGIETRHDYFPSYWLE